MTLFNQNAMIRWRFQQKIGLFWYADWWYSFVSLFAAHLVFWKLKHKPKNVSLSSIFPISFFKSIVFQIIIQSSFEWHFKSYDSQLLSSYACTEIMNFSEWLENDSSIREYFLSDIYPQGWYFTVLHFFCWSVGAILSVSDLSNFIWRRSLTVADDEQQWASDKVSSSNL